MIARFTAAACENDLLWLSAEQFGNLFTGFFHGVVSSLAKRMCARRIAETFLQIGQQGLDDHGIKRSGGIIVEINRLHDLHRFDQKGAVAREQKPWRLRLTRRGS